MQPPTRIQARRMVADRLAELVGDEDAAKLRDNLRAAVDSGEVLRAGGRTFVLEYRASGAAAPVAAAAERAVRQAQALGKQALPLVAAPFMGPIGRERCQRAGVAWLDLSGNAHIVAPGIRIRIEGGVNKFRGRGRPSSVFAPKAARVSRWLLMHPHHAQSQRDIATATRMDEGYTSRIVARLERQYLIVRDEYGRIRPRDPDLLLDAWRESYGFEQHQVLRGHVAARSGNDALRQLARQLERHEAGYAATGLAAAWILTRFAGFRLVTLYLREYPSTALLEALHFHEETRGANVWLVVPKDLGVLHGLSEHAGIPCAHPAQVYLDLTSHPERAKEAADHLRTECLNWSRGDRETSDSSGISS